MTQTFRTKLDEADSLFCYIRDIHSWSRTVLLHGGRQTPRSWSLISNFAAEIFNVINCWENGFL